VRRTILLLTMMALGLLLATSGVALAATKVVTKTFTNSSGITIVDATATQPGTANPYPSKIKVSGFNQGRIRDVNLNLKGFSHSFTDDVGVLLVGPHGQKALVMSDVGGTAAVSGITLHLDDEAATPLPDSTQLKRGTYKPTQGTSVPPNESNPIPANFPASSAPGQPPAGPYGTSLSVFDGTNPNGTWKLYVVDDSEQDSGTIGSWSLQVKARVTV
jgi:subtilisin-like proprotein convertase family protein